MSVLIFKIAFPQHYTTQVNEYIYIYMLEEVAVARIWGAGGFERKLEAQALIVKVWVINRATRAAVKTSVPFNIDSFFFAAGLIE